MSSEPAVVHVLAPSDPLNVDPPRSRLRVQVPPPSSTDIAATDYPSADLPSPQSSDDSSSASSRRASSTSSVSVDEDHGRACAALLYHVNKHPGVAPFGRLCQLRVDSRDAIEIVVEDDFAEAQLRAQSDQNLTIKTTVTVTCHGPIPFLDVSWLSLRVIGSGWANNKKLSKGAAAEHALHCLCANLAGKPIPPPTRPVRSANVIRQLEAASHHLTVARSLRGSSSLTLVLSLDMEWHDASHPRLTTEVGFAWFLLDGVIASSVSAHHYIVAEHQHLRNRHLIHDHRGRFEYGSSQTLPISDLQARVKTLLDRLAATGLPIVLAGHSMDSDETLLASTLGVSIDATLRLDIAQALQSMDDADHRISLGKICARYGVAARYPHNAGNDAAYTALATRAFLRQL